MGKIYENIFLLKKLSGKEAGKLYIHYESGSDEILYIVKANTWVEAKKKIKAEYLVC